MYNYSYRETEMDTGISPEHTPSFMTFIILHNFKRSDFFVTVIIFFNFMISGSKFT